MPLTAEQAADLSALGDSASSIESKLDSIKRWAFWRTAFLVVGLVVIGLYALSIHNDFSRYQHDTQRVRVNACIQSVAKEKDQARIEKSNERARRDQSPAAKALTTRFLAQLGITQAELDRLNAAQLAHFDSEVDKAHRLRDCTDAGLADYFAGKGGYLPTPTTIKGALP